MANSFNIPEVTFDELGDSTHAINLVNGAVVGTGKARTNIYQPLVVRVTDADGDTGVDADTEAKLEAGAVLFMSKRHGEPFTRNGNKDNGLQHIIHQAAATPAVPSNTTVLYPNFDYTTFE